MTWWQIALIIYGGLNIIIAAGITVVSANDGYYTNWNSGKILWGRATLIFVVLLLFGLPVVIVGMIVLTFEG